MSCSLLHSNALSRNASKLLSCLRYAAPRRYSTSFSALRDEMLLRPSHMIYDTLSAANSWKLQRSLAGFLPTSWFHPDSHVLLDYENSVPTLPPAHHLVYFNPTLSSNELLPDGTDPLQSPGAPFVRRMWAGGSVRFRPSSMLLEGKPLSLTGSQHVLMEMVRDVEVKGKEGDEKIFVGIERRIGRATRLPAQATVNMSLDDALRKELYVEDKESFGKSSLIEKRTLVFMREKTPEQAREAVEQATTKIIKASKRPDFSHSLIPTRELLFRYSALTFNAHAIHLDRQYCREIEGHRNLLVHGPLSLTLLLTMLNAHIRGNGRNPDLAIQSIDYRNLAPLYCDEEMKLCGRRVRGEGNTYEVWIENSAGGMCVRGTAKVAAVVKPLVGFKN